MPFCRQRTEDLFEGFYDIRPICGEDFSDKGDGLCTHVDDGLEGWMIYMGWNSG